MKLLLFTAYEIFWICCTTVMFCMHVSPPEAKWLNILRFVLTSLLVILSRSVIVVGTIPFSLSVKIRQGFSVELRMCHLQGCLLSLERGKSPGHCFDFLYSEVLENSMKWPQILIVWNIIRSVTSFLHSVSCWKAGCPLDHVVFVCQQASCTISCHNCWNHACILHYINQMWNTQ